MRPSFKDYTWSHISLTYKFRSQDPTSSGQHQNNDNVLHVVCKERIGELKGGLELAWLL